MTLRIVPMALAFLLLAAHFLRGGQALLVMVCLAAPFLLLARRHWARRVVQALLYGGALVWLYTAGVLTHERWLQGAPWIRMSAILAAVGALTLTAGLLLNSPTVKQRFR